MATKAKAKAVAKQPAKKSVAPKQPQAETQPKVEANQWVLNVEKVLDLLKWISAIASKIADTKGEHEAPHGYVKLDFYISFDKSWHPIEWDEWTAKFWFSWVTPSVVACTLDTIIEQCVKQTVEVIPVENRKDAQRKMCAKITHTLNEMLLDTMPDEVREKVNSIMQQIKSS